MWRAYFASFILGMPSTNALIRRLEDDANFRQTCGFGETLPHRTTFNRFISRLDRYKDLVEACFASQVNRLATLLPGLGEKIAVDSTTVRSHSNPHRTSKLTKRVSDPQATWTAKTSPGSKVEKDWYWGYKFHLVVDATYGIPLYGYTTTASKHDGPELLRILDGAAEKLSWLNPRYVMADKGYESQANHEATLERGAVLVAPTRRKPRNALFEGVYTEKGVPTCLGMVPMEYVRSDPQRGHLYRCRPERCHLTGRKARRYCNQEVWEDRSDNLRLFGPIRQGSPEWKDLYGLRQSVERVFKSMKESRRLERHFIRGLHKISLHAAMSVLGFTATFLVNLMAGDAQPRWMVRKVA